MNGSLCRLLLLAQGAALGAAAAPAARPLVGASRALRCAAFAAEREAEPAPPAPPPPPPPPQAAPDARGGASAALALFGARSAPLVLGLGGGNALDKSLSRLPMAAQYNAVLQGTLGRGSAGAEALALVDEMSRARIRLTPESAAQLVDACELADVAAMARTFETLARNPAGTAYGYCARSLETLPAAAPGRAGARRQRALDALGAAPTDDSRGAEGAALVASVVGALALAADELAAALAPAPGVFAPPPLLVAALAAAAFAADRYSNRGEGARLLARAAGRLGSGSLAREAAADAAACSVGYALGLPWCALEPRASRVARLPALEALAAAEGGAGGGGGEGRGARVVDRTLVWLLAPAAAEAAEFDGVLRVAEPAQAAAFLAALRRAPAADALLADGGWGADEDGVRVDWAYAQAARILKQVAPAHEGLRRAMEEGGLSAGRAVVLVEQALR
jgi:hypothetical protein